MSIEIAGVGKHFGDFVALDDINLTIPSGQLTALLGPSGGGKSTLLRIIAGLESADSGTVTIEGVDATGLPPQRRNVGFVFQHYAVFKHMTVAKNVAFGLEIRKRPKQEVRRRVDELLDLVHLRQFADRLPSQLSGGQRQRMALARALAVEPKVLLLDEPFGALDAKTRQELRRWLRRLHRELHVTSVLVTHDQEEALEVADRVVIMNAGRIEQTGTPEEVFHKPASEFVMNFLGHVNIFHGRVEGDKAILGPLEIQYAGQYQASTRPARGLVRPYDLDLELRSNGKPGFRATVRHINSAGPRVKVELTAASGEPVHVELPHDRFQALKLVPGAEVFVVPRDINVFIDEG